MGGLTFMDQMVLEADAARAGRYHVEVSGEWNCPVVPQGGMMTAIAARAMGLELERRGAPSVLRSLTTVFAAAVPAGPVTVDVTVLRQGRSMAQLRAEIRAPGADAGHSTLAVFGGTRPGFAFTDVTMPDVPPPAECPSFRDPLPEGVERIAIPFWERAEGRPAMAHAQWDQWMPSTSECAFWYRFEDPPRRPDGSLDPLGLIPFCDLNAGVVRERMGPDTPTWMPPSADLTVHLFGEPVPSGCWAATRPGTRATGSCPRPSICGIPRPASWPTPPRSWSSSSPMVRLSATSASPST